MQRNKILHSFIRLIILILLSLKLIVGGFEQIDYIQNYLPSWELAFGLETILIQHLYIHPFLVFVAITGVFIRKRIGVVLMLVYPLWVITNALLNCIFPLRFIWNVDEYRLILAVILVLLTNSLQMIKSNNYFTIKENVFLNGTAFLFGLLISTGIWFLYDRITL